MRGFQHLTPPELSTFRDFLLDSPTDKGWPRYCTFLQGSGLVSLRSASLVLGPIFELYELIDKRSHLL